MVVRCILVPATPTTENGIRLQAACLLSRRLKAHFHLQLICRDTTAIYENLPDVALATGIKVEQIQAEDRERITRAKLSFQDFCAAAGVMSNGQARDLTVPFGCWTETIGEIEPLVASVGRVSDMIVVGRPRSGDMTSERIFDAAVFSSGRPTLVVPEHLPDDPLRHVVIAWNGSLEAARVVGHSISLLHEADRVSIVTAPADSDGDSTFADLRDYLMWHGIRAHPLELPTSARSVGAALLAGAANGNATLMIMGAYTHSRLRQFLLGGATRHILDHASIPILMEH